MIGGLASSAADVPVPLTAHSALVQWQFAPVVSAALAVAAVLYAWGMWRVRRRHPSRPWPLQLASAFAAGLLVVAVATQSSIAVYDDVLFADHMVQHLLLIMVAPALLVLGRPGLLALHASRNPAHRWLRAALRSKAVTVLTWPPLVLLLYAAVIVGTHLTPFMNLVLRHHLVHDGEHALYLATGYLFFLPAVGSEPIRWRLSYPGRLLLLALAMPVDTFTGVILGMTTREPFPAYAAVPRGWGPGLLADLHLGGAIMWVGGDGLMVAVIAVVVLQYVRDGSSRVGMGRWLESARSSALAAHAAAAGVVAPPTAATVDDDAHLIAYNAYLARLDASSAAPEVLR